jgi:predicted Zn-dependent protease
VNRRIVWLIAACLPLTVAAQKPGDRVEQDYREALAAIGQGHVRLAEQKLAHALALSPKDDDVRLTLAQLMIDDGRRADAYRLLEEGFARNAGRFALPLARLQFEDGHYAAVVETLSRPPRRDGGNPWRDALLGAAHRELGRYPDAVDAFKRALEVEHGNTVWSLALADCLVALQRDAEARTVLERAGMRSEVAPEQRDLIEERLAEIAERR